jgi:hypothetical protein
MLQVRMNGLTVMTIVMRFKIGASFTVLFRFVEEQAHGHERGLSAIFVILQNDGDDLFCTAYIALWCKLIERGHRHRHHHFA